MQTNEDVLVSVCVVTYNSEATVLETLDSILNQTYQNIELIVSDDCSKDNTIEKCTQWREQHINRFVDIKILTVSENSGVPANCNRAVAAANGKWIKIIAADDCLLPNCISDDVSYTRENPMIQILYTNYYCFTSDDKGSINIVEERLSKRINKLFNTTPKKQLEVYIKNRFNIMPSVFMKKELINHVGGFIEKYKLFEDAPFLTKVLLANHKIYHLSTPTVLYRVDNNSITRESSKKIFFKTKFYDYYWQFIQDMILPNIDSKNISFKWNVWSYRILYLFVIKLLNNKRSKYNYFVYLLFKGANPYFFIMKCKNLFLK